MKKISSYFMLFLITIFSFVGNIHATPIVTNFGFETGDFTGWDIISGTAGSSIKAETIYYGADWSYSAPYGTYFTLLDKILADDQHPIIEQAFTIGAGDSISGKAAFDANGDHYRHYNDAASVKIYAGGTQIAMPWYMDHATVGFNNQTPWQNWSWTASSSGTYVVRYALYDIGDAGSPR